VYTDHSVIASRLLAVAYARVWSLSDLHLWLSPLATILSLPQPRDSSTLDHHQRYRRATYIRLISPSMEVGADNTPPSNPDMAAELLDANRRALALALKKTDTNNSNTSAARLEMMKAESRFHSLKRRGRALRYEEATAAREYGQSWCESFSQSLLNKLPRELRDMIYDHLLPRSAEVSLLGQDWRVSSGPRWTFSSWNDSELDPIPHYLTSEFMGTAFQKEILEELHRRAKHSIYRPNDVEEFLENGLPLASLPLRAFDFVRSLTVLLSFQPHQDVNKLTWRRTAQFELRQHLEGDPQHLESVATNHTFEKKVKVLAVIAKIKQLNKLELHILIRTWTPTGARGFERALVPFVHDLQDRGVKVDGEVQSYRRDSRRNTDIYSSWKCDFTRPGSR